MRAPQPGGNIGEGEEGFVTGVHATGTLAEESPSFTAQNLEYTHCHVVSFGITFPITVDPNGCDFKFNAGTYNASLGTEGGSEGSAEIQCPGEAEITVTMFNTEDTSHVESPRCVIHVPPQEAQGTILYTNIKVGGKKAVTMETEGTAVEATKTNSGTFGCSSHVTDPEAEYEGAAITRGTKPAGEFVDTWVTPTA